MRLFSATATPSKIFPFKCSVAQICCHRSCVCNVSIVGVSWKVWTLHGRWMYRSRCWICITKSNHSVSIDLKGVEKLRKRCQTGPKSTYLSHSFNVLFSLGMWSERGMNIKVALKLKSNSSYFNIIFSSFCTKIRFEIFCFDDD